MQTTGVQQVVDHIERAERIALLSVSNPDGDRIASLIALARALENMDKDVTLVLPDPLPRSLLFLPVTYAIRPFLRQSYDYTLRVPLGKSTTLDRIEYQKDEQSLFIHLTTSAPLSEKIPVLHPVDAPFDLFILVGVDDIKDVSIFHEDPEPLFQTPLVSLHTKPISQEHFVATTQNFAALSFSEITTEILEQLQKQSSDLEIIDEQVAMALLTGIFLATQRLTHPATHPRTVQTTSRLMSYGADQQQILEALGETIEQLPIDPLNKKLNQLSFDAEHQFIHAHLSQEPHHGIEIEIVQQQLRQHFPDAKHLLLSWSTPHDEHPAAPLQRALFTSQDQKAVHHIAQATQSKVHNGATSFQTINPAMAKHIARLVQQL